MFSCDLRESVSRLDFNGLLGLSQGCRLGVDGEPLPYADQTRIGDPIGLHQLARRDTVFSCDLRESVSRLDDDLD